MDPDSEQVPSVRRTRPDRCPGVLRPWPADDGLLVRLRVPGGWVPTATLAALVAVAEEYGDGAVHLTSRGNIQVRAMPAEPGTDLLRADAVAALEATGLLPSRAHDVARNVLASPASGLAGGRGDVRPVARALDAALLADEALGRLPGRFLFVLDDGRGDLLDRGCDLGAVLLDERTAQVRVGEQWGAVVGVAAVPGVLAALAVLFLAVRGDGPDAAWHVDELAAPLARLEAPDPRVPEPSAALPYGPGAAGVHLAVPEGGLTRDFLPALTTPGVVVTPWRGVLVPREKP